MRETMDATATVAARGPVTHGHTASDRALSWGAILGGAVAAAALSLILLALGFGLGLSSISPWSYEGASAKAIGLGSAAWLLVMSALASGLGGFLAGRLRAKWLDVDADEAFFRDTAHGFLAWAVATLVSAAVLTSAASSMVGSAAKAAAVGGVVTGAAAVAGTNTAANATEGSRDYFVDMMFRGTKADTAENESTRREAGLILSRALKEDLSQGDRSYLGQLVSARTGMAPNEADQRVTQTAAAAKLTAEAAEAKAKEAADVARKAAATTALWVFVSLLLGAFCATLAATWGGKGHDFVSYRRQPI